MEITKKQRSIILEQGPGFGKGLRDLKNHLNAETISAGIISSIFGCTGPALVVIDAATNAGYSTADIVTWLFGIYVFGGLLGVLMSLYYKIPISGAFTIPGAAMLSSALVGVPFNEAAGAFVMAGVIVLVLGLSGLISKLMKWLPLPIIMAMIAGAMVRFGTGIISGVIVMDPATGALNTDALIVGLATLTGFFVVPKFVKKIPPVLIALILGVGAAIATGSTNFATGGVEWIAPRLVAPTFKLDSIIAVSIPLAVLVIGAENSQAVGVLYVQGYKPPINSITIFSGIGGIVSGLFGAHNANVAGPMTAICSSEEAGENKEGRYAASVVNGITFAIFGLFASGALGFVRALPAGLISILAGLAMMNVLIQSFDIAFSARKFRVGTFAALVVAMSGITILKIGAPFWSLIIGVVISLLADTEDFKTQKE